MDDSPETYRRDLADAQRYADGGPLVTPSAVGRLIERLRRAEAALAAVRAESAEIRGEHRALRAELDQVSADLDQARSEARATQQEVRADLEMLRAEVTVAADPDDPEDQRL